MGEARDWDLVVVCVVTFTAPRSTLESACPESGWMIDFWFRRHVSAANVDPPCEVFNN